MKFARKNDFIIIALIAVVCILALILFNNISVKRGAVAEIYYQTELVKTVLLTDGKDEDFIIDQVPNVVFHLYPDGSIAFIQSDCPDQICVRAGRLYRAGQTAACLPNKLYLKIIADGPGEAGVPDIIIG